MQVKDGELVDITRAWGRCTTCGAMIFNLSFRGIATGEYGEGRNGIRSRKFVLLEGERPICECAPYVWVPVEDKEVAC